MVPLSEAARLQHWRNPDEFVYDIQKVIIIQARVQLVNISHGDMLTKMPRKNTSIQEQARWRDECGTRNTYRAFVAASFVLRRPPEYSAPSPISEWSSIVVMYSSSAFLQEQKNECFQTFKR